MMDIEVVDPALRQATLALPRTDPSKKIIRVAIRLATRVMPVPRVEGVAVSTVKSGRLRLRCYRPDAQTGAGALVWIHGGGLLFGDARQDEALVAQTALDLGIPIISVNYRFAPEHPFPAAHNDVFEAWEWALAHASDFGVGPDRFAIGGESAGGGLVAALVQRIYDEGGPQPVAQWLFAPMIDDRTAVDRSLDAAGHWVWDNRANRVGWTGYLGTAIGAAELPPYAAAARRIDLTGLPPAYIAVGDIELFLAEDQAYANRLREAGVAVTLDIVPGAPHGFENWAGTTEPAQALMLRARQWLRDRMLAGSASSES